MKKLFLLAVAIMVAMALLSPPAMAGTVTGTVASLHIRNSDGLISLEMNGSATGKPGCATYSYWMIKSENSDTGKRQYALLIAAKLAGATITVTGANTCVRWIDGEDIESISIF